MNSDNVVKSEVLRFNRPARPGSEAQASLRLTINSEPLIIHDVSVLRDELTGGYRFSLPRYKSISGKGYPAIQITTELRSQIEAVLIPAFLEWKARQEPQAQSHSDAQNAAPQPKEVR